MEVDVNMKIYTLIKEYPQIEEYLIELSPRYKKLKNPILRRTVARVATLRQAAMIGGFSSSVFVNLLRVKLGQSKIEIKDADIKILDELPSWVKGKKPKFIVNAPKLLDESKNPLSYTNKKLKRLKDGEFILLKSDFVPAPLIEEAIKKGFISVTLKADQDQWYDTYIGLE